MIHPRLTVFDALESAAIRLSNKPGKFLEPLGRKGASCLSKQFGCFSMGVSFV